ncbi:2-succinyl-5-enolpyruvyl-6-hydroxy-3-cyclohexene-1-carboxylic-acid synthase [Shewanella eurypsychrophilus]|uniref:2-succinyl-5-enolpyruvyl-6-hydroxy-3-cyclohexene-1-carboxylate synthase n=1 Tax=Shewanella eurypsychrophilus TaxID=2593656 RepID=A0ABX6V0T6_9GAMM|nr:MULTISPECIES: 2-succinyl-5-enolpyruvyl-6-hydroxy-3-cyclohexene-1-carboxylic-acid synthase [Shewanella]QFU20636.1 2-succinyl-5-enolpyruvyl-6-hydroxy-3-cyclohexene-1-carboxylic-acid synthase [Shewanella sp. YLB-09]QFU20916.1 2-succinyl-5-enolpyruvyl-6-hydroxy-3-cyclohexene-1-carboxylic-acid synthase [Shewanella sp. YLB-09]QPG56204.1 2-succinyl-5-enolpyruvyl-6-hydroxy-3-cyclohexene-1-carboxylic-acid synthase [Shewanella eurypsychrophilus]
MQIEKTAELNLLWGTLILEELARLGVKHICMAPGSRSTPLTLAAAKQIKLKQHLHFDERGLGFMALGLAKASQAPVAIITTSGTAVANLYPAIIEAWLTHVPLIVLSGDRPPELIDCGANQAIIQPAIFAQYAKQINLPTPDITIRPEALLTTLDEAVSNQSQPVHINCMYREPLYPSTMSANFTKYLSTLGNWQHASQPYVQYGQAKQQSMPTQDSLARFVHGKGVIIAGTLTPEESPEALILLSQKLGWPLLTDAQSQLRQHPGVIGNIDQLLHHPKAKSLLQQAERVIVFGGRLLSKSLINYLAEQKWKSYWQVLPHHIRLDPSHSAKQVWHCDLKSFSTQSWPRSSEINWALELTQLNDKVETLFQQQIDNGEFGEAMIVRAIAKAQRPLQQLFIGNSLPIRLYDMYAPTTPEYGVTYTNRGASGIDGLLATACGTAKHKGIPTTLIIGDISQLHDLNSLAIARTIDSPFVVVILNNDGGNIFNLLPVPDEKLRNDYYRLSHGLEFGYAAAMFGLAYNQVDDIESFNEAYQDAIGFNGASVIEVTVSQNQASDQIAKIASWVKQN